MFSAGGSTALFSLRQPFGGLEFGMDISGNIFDTGIFDPRAGGDTVLYISAVFFTPSTLFCREIPDAGVSDRHSVSGVDNSALGVAAGNKFAELF